MDRKELALQLHHSKFNCAQSVVCAFAHVMGYDPQTVFKMSEAFGFGMGNMGTCGAVSGMAMVIGMMKSDGDLDDPKTKKKCYNLMKLAQHRFEEKNGSVICKEIKGVETGKVLRSCDGCIEDAVAILDELLLDIK
ncbi:MAG: C_GCAxxG_C_C family protein [Firmicutes bacterium]|nr:C_GCAxxG_C_C family protein [Bacillota bacterium]